MGRTHALSGVVVGLLVAPLLGAGGAAELAAVAVTTGGFALLPDLDHPGSSASRLLGPVTGWVSHGLRAVSGALYQATKGPRDERGSGTHRHLSHTLVFALLIALVSAGVSGLGPWATLAVAGVGVLLAEAALGEWVLLAAAITVVPVLTDPGGPAVAAAELQGWIGLAAGLGCVVHCLGDGLTHSGVPLLWPIPIAGETWFELGPPRPLRFRTGSWVENLLITPVFLLVAAGLAWQGMGGQLWPLS